MANSGMNFASITDMLTKLNYNSWSIKKKALLGAKDLREITENGFEEVEAGDNQAQKDVLKETWKKDKKALYILYQSVDNDTFKTTYQCWNIIKPTWDKLQSTHRGVDYVKKVRLQTLRGVFESLQMKEMEMSSRASHRCQPIEVPE